MLLILECKRARYLRQVKLEIKREEGKGEKEREKKT
jgi:hypothetical protein